jgi:formamidopyrimidine-DNA glycosylase
MPELPEVETIVRQLRSRGVEGRTIVSVSVAWPRSVEPLSPDQFSGLLVGSTIEQISRVGKWMILSLGTGRSLMIHLRMSGSFSMSPGSHDRIVMQLSDGLTLYYRDTRKFGRWKLVDDPRDMLDKLGPDALTRSFSKRYFVDLMHRRNRSIKALLLDQTVVAGIGNIYADEALWESGIHPGRSSSSLSDAELEALHRAIKHVLRVGVANRGTSLGEGKTNYRDVEGASGGHRAVVKAYGRTGLPCVRCGTALTRITVAQRGTHICPECQKIKK